MYIPQGYADMSEYWHRDPSPPELWHLDCECHPRGDGEHLPSDWLNEMPCRAGFSSDRRPNYFVSDPKSLITTSRPLNFTLGTGPQILSSVLPLCLETKHELIIVTCFWAKESISREDVASLLRKLSAKAIQQNRIIQVRICFSSESSWRRLNPCRMEGKIHHPRSWKRLGLPAEGEIKGLELVVKSAFVPPFSVMHPKFILMDRKTAWMPSCNVSWENWFEGCIEMQGGITEKIHEFWVAFWGNRGAELPPLPESEMPSSNSLDLDIISSEMEQARAHIASQTQVSLSEIPTILLPSPHHWDPTFILHCPHTTPFTTFLHHIFRAAKSSIYIQTPNLTSRPVVKAIVAAIMRGVDVRIITSRRLMILEQLVTAGTHTEYEVRYLARHYARLKHKKKREIRKHERGVRRGWGLAPPVRLGSLSVGYYQPKEGKDPNEPVKSHLKLVCVDGQVTILGSGNMDRASWYTSQELAVAFFSEELSAQLSESVDEALKDRVKYAYQLSM